MKDSDYTKYCYSFRHRGHLFALNIFAEDWADAEEIAKELNLTFDGEWGGEVVVPPEEAEGLKKAFGIS